MIPCPKNAIGKAPRRRNGSTPFGTSPCCALPGIAIKLVNRDFRDLLAVFNAHGVEYLVVGAHALAAHGHVRATKDLDVWVRPEADNAKGILKILELRDEIAEAEQIYNEFTSNEDLILQLKRQLELIIPETVSYKN